MARPLLALPLLLLTHPALAQPDAAQAPPVHAQPDPAAVLAKAGPAVARLDCRGQSGMAVVFADRDHAITARSLVLWGRPVKLTFADGSTVKGQALKGPKDAEFAVIKLETPAPADPPALAETLPALGDAVALVGRAPTFDDERPAVAVGPVVSVGDGLFHVDASVGDHAVGAPVLDGQGRLKGIVLDGGDGLRPVLPAKAFAQTPPDDAVDHGRLMLAMNSGLMMGVSTDRTMNTGLYSGFRLVAWDQLQLDARLGILFDSDLPADDTTHIDRQKFGLFVDALAGYRFDLASPEVGPLQVTLSAGVTIQQHNGYLRSLGQDGAIVKTPIDEAFTRPAAQISLRALDWLDLNYTWDINPDDLGASSHRFGVGFGF